MPPEDEEPLSERSQTDESLRAERETADDALGEQLVAIEETADAVISRARARADEVLAKARAKTDRRSESPPQSEPPNEMVKLERALEDKAVRKERADADETVRVERVEQAAHLSTEREETDNDLLSERARADGALATRDEFLGVVSHDLRNMLHSMVGFAALIEQEASRENQVAQVRTHAQRIQRAGARMTRLVGDLVDVASIEAGRLAVTRELGDPAQVLREAVETFQAQATVRGVSLVAEIEGPLVPILVDASRILQVLTNLLSNAIKFTPEKGKVVARVERVGDETRFSVSDTGAGIPKDQLEAVFERFFQVAPNDRRGVGLGLYISKCIVQGHGGKIWAESSMGEGTTVSFTLPVDLGV